MLLHVNQTRRLPQWHDVAAARLLNQSLVAWQRDQPCMAEGASTADSDEAGRGFRLKAATHSDLKAATIPI